MLFYPSYKAILIGTTFPLRTTERFPYEVLDSDGCWDVLVLLQKPLW